MAHICKWIVRLAGVLYLVALGLLVTGTVGLFGQASDPLAGVFLIPLGLPWVLWTDGVTDTFKPWLAILAPAVNLIILATACLLLRGAKA
ncbi:MAG: hypothetical protein ACFB21_07300 [Opitutales bacterium]